MQDTISFHDQAINETQKFLLRGSDLDKAAIHRSEHPTRGECQSQRRRTHEWYALRPTLHLCQSPALQG